MRRLKLAAELTRGLVAEALNIRIVATAAAAERLSNLLPQFDLIDAELIARCSGAACAQAAAPPTTPTPAPSRAATPTGPTNEIYALLTAVDTVGAGSVTYDEIQWFSGSQAARECAADGVKPSGAWCTNYYYRNANSRQRTATFGPAPRIALLNGRPPAVPATRAQLAAQVASQVEYIYTLRMADGVITELTQVYTP